jgi:tRNA G10  N-methylase Trm11
MYLYFLGSNPALSLAELESLLGHKNIGFINQSNNIIESDSELSLKRLGGVVKIAKIITKLNIDADLENELARIVVELKPSDRNKLNLGISVFGKKMPPPTISKLAFKIKQRLKPTLNLRVVPNKNQELGSAQLAHLKLNSGGLELNLIFKKNSIYVASTVESQNLKNYTLRDYGRPARDAKVGMLPPKLAQIMLNLSLRDAKSGIVLDPFCGTGVVLQEAMFAGFNAIGTDIEPRMIEFSQTNLKWAKLKFKINSEYSLEVGDATSTLWPKFNFVVSEVFLGRPLTKLPPRADLEEIIKTVNTITKKFLLNLKPQINNQVRLCLAVPSWRDGNKFIDLPLIDQLEVLGYNRLSLSLVTDDDLLYYRKDSIVARRILLLKIKEN